MIRINKAIGRHYDLTIQAGGGTTAPSEPLIGKTAITYAGSLPSVVLKYEDIAMTNLLFTTNVTWLNGLPMTIATQNHSNGIIATTTLNWSNGSLESVDKILT